MATSAINHTAVVSPASGITARVRVLGTATSVANAKNTTLNPIVNGPPMLPMAVIHTYTVHPANAYGQTRRMPATLDDRGRELDAAPLRIGDGEPRRDAFAKRQLPTRARRPHCGIVELHQCTVFVDFDDGDVEPVTDAVLEDDGLGEIGGGTVEGVGAMVGAGHELGQRGQRRANPVGHARARADG